MPQALIMVGFPASGKSTYTKEKIPETYRVVDFDSWINKYAQEEGLDYRQSFDKYAKRAVAAYDESIGLSLSAGENIVIDKTNLTRKGRMKTIHRINSYNNDYEITAIWISTPYMFCIDRAKKREPYTNGKVIPENVFSSMLSSFEYPTLDEGFNSIVETRVK